MAEDPFQVFHFDNDEVLAAGKKDGEKWQKFEIKLIEEAVTKIGALLLLGFGEAGSYIVA